MPCAARMASRLILSTPPLVRPPVLGWPLARPGFPAPAISNLFYFKFCSRYVRSGPLSTNFAPLGSLLAAPRARGADHEYFRQDYVQDFSSRRGDGLGRRAPKLLHRPTGLRHQGFPVGRPRHPSMWRRSSTESVDGRAEARLEAFDRRSHEAA